MLRVSRYRTLTKLKGGKYMRKPRLPMQDDMPRDIDMLEVYIHKNAGYNKSGLRRIKRSLRKLAAV